MQDLIAIDDISISPGQTYGKDGKEIKADIVVIIESGESFSLPTDRAAILLKRNAVKKGKSNPKGAKGAG